MIVFLSLRGSKDPNKRVLGPKYYNINGIWALKPYYFSPWTLKVYVKIFVTPPVHLKPEMSTETTFGMPAYWKEMDPNGEARSTGCPRASLESRYPSSTLLPFLFWVSLLKLNSRKKGTLIINGLLGNIREPRNSGD